MRAPAIPEVLPAHEADLAQVLPADQPKDHPRGRGVTSSNAFLRAIGSFFGWIWRFLVGSLFCMNYFTGILVTGWTYRWMQAIVLRGWWRQSRLRYEGSFEEFCADMGIDAPVIRPRWFWQERIAAAWAQPAADGTNLGFFRALFRVLRIPWASLWLNFKVGVQALFCTYFLTGWGCLLMLFSWSFGWDNSFSKGYEQAFIGPLTGFLGIFLFIAAMFYVPMAQAHQAATGDYRAFFDFRFVWRLIQARSLSYVGLASVIAVASLPLEILKTAPVFFDDHFEAWTNASDVEVVRMLQGYLLVCCMILFPTLLLARLLAALLYRSAVLKVIRQGWLARRDLHPVLAGRLDRLGLNAAPESAVPAPGLAVGSAGWWLIGAFASVVVALAFGALFAAGPLAWLGVLGIWLLTLLLFAPFFVLRRGGVRRYLCSNGRGLLFALLFWIWFGFIAKVYVGEFFNYHPVTGFMNHALVQLPSFDLVPAKLQQSANH